MTAAKTLVPSATGNALWTRPARIMVATDLADLHHLASFAIEEAKHFGAELMLIHVLPNFASPTMAPSLLVFSHPEEHIRHAEEKLSAVARQAADEGIRCTWETNTGDVLKEIARGMEAWHADRLIVGSKGTSKYSLHVVGSISEQVFRSTLLPVMIVGPHVAASQKPQLTQQILVPVSMKRDSRFLFRKAAELQVYGDARITLLHVIANKRPEIGQSARMADCRMAVSALMEEASLDGNPARVEVRCGDVTEKILHEARTGGFDTIVMGNMTASSFVPHIVPSSAYSVLCDAPCPVLIVTDERQAPVSS